MQKQLVPITDNSEFVHRLVTMAVNKFLKENDITIEQVNNFRSTETVILQAEAKLDENGHVQFDDDLGTPVYRKDSKIYPKFLPKAVNVPQMSLSDLVN